jgi:hypothetical protein
VAIRINDLPILEQCEEILRESRKQRPKDLTQIFENACSYLLSILKTEPSLLRDAMFAEGFGAIMEEGRPLGESLGSYLTSSQIKIISSALKTFDRPDTLFDVRKYSYLRAFILPEAEKEGDFQEEGVEPEAFQPSLRNAQNMQNPSKSKIVHPEDFSKQRACSFFSFF